MDLTTNFECKLIAEMGEGGCGERGGGEIHNF